ncbi:DNA methyltransferase [Dehalococcoides mccartyi]|uniref:DNA methyltransferase n=1 Tax=Dehalococcoides mccartyi TaxID=61435 RepID=UPI000B216BB0|nr:DNA methyltransferase [Dehalococcoides mccartyi]
MNNNVKKQSLFASAPTSEIESNPVECLGIKFPSDSERRKYFKEKLKEKLKDPSFRQIEGFPVGNDEDILGLSDPPYYTACPNPFIGDFIHVYGKPYDEKSDNYSREPFAADISEGKNDPIYNAHTYHTKVPYKAIMRYILHYTEPGDIVLDGFCGTGMTGVAAQICANPDPEFKNSVQQDMPTVHWGARKTVLSDLCPAATFISNTYNLAANIEHFEKEMTHILEEVKEQFGWMYETLHIDGRSKGRIHYVVWSDVFVCSNCSQNIVFFNSAYSTAVGVVEEEFNCPHCQKALKKRFLEHTIETYYDPILKITNKRNKQVPVLISYSVGSKRYEKSPTKEDFEILNKIEHLISGEVLISHPMMNKGGEGWGAIWRSGYHFGITHTHHFYTIRNFIILSKIWNKCMDSQSRWALTGILNYVNKKQSFTGGGGGMPGVLYIASLVQEKNVFEVLERKMHSLVSTFTPDYRKKTEVIISTQSSGDLKCLEKSSIDYIFVDPPFGGNIMYSEGSFLWESWLRVFTNNKPEAIENPAQDKKLKEYQELMTTCFKEFFRVLKSGRWMTVEFHNSQNSVWNAIQEGLQQAGFVVADVRSLDKQQGSFKQVTTAGAVKQDLIISAYKPSNILEKKFGLEAGTESGAWDFIREHLKQLPIFVGKNNQAEVVAERQGFMLYDRMVAFHVQHGILVPLSAAEFYAGLSEKFPERDGMYFLPEQSSQYEKKRMSVRDFQQLALIVQDESSAIQWLRQSLYEKPQTFQELHPQFMREIGGWQQFEKPLELKEMLEQNFIAYDGVGEVPSQIHAYLSTNFHEYRCLAKDNSLLKAKAKDRWYVPDPNKAIDLEKLRDRSLLREFQDYTQTTQKKLKVFRLEAVRAGFKRAWAEADYKTIVNVAEKLPASVLEEDQMLLMWYSNAQTRMGEKLI